MEIIWLNALLKGVLQGVTEFLPISSTGHLILVRDWLPLCAQAASPEHRKTFDEAFDIIIQFPSILAVLILYRQRLWKAASAAASDVAMRRFWLGLFAAFLPAAAVGFVAHHWIEKHLEKPFVVAMALLVGGIIILAVEKLLIPRGAEHAEQVPLKTSLGIGLFQCLALIPGTSRSGATIIGARVLGLNRETAAEYSFFLALPTLGAACLYKFAKSYQHIAWREDGMTLLIGAVASFIVSYIVAGWLIRYLRTQTLSIFGWYRIVLGLLVLLFACG